MNIGEVSVEVDGIRFETLMPERVLSVPENKPGSKTPIELGIRVTNNTTTTALHFCFYYAITPELMMPDGKIRRVGSYFSDWLEEPSKSDFPLTQPGEAVTFFPGALLYSLGNDLFQFIFFVGNGGYWIFEPLYSGNYQIRLVYKNTTQRRRVYYPENLKNKLIENIWTGTVTMPFIEFKLL